MSNQNNIISNNDNNIKWCCCCFMQYECTLPCRLIVACASFLVDPSIYLSFPLLQSVWFLWFWRAKGSQYRCIVEWKNVSHKNIFYHQLTIFETVTAGVHFINVLQAPFSYESAFLEYEILVWNFWRQNFVRKLHADNVDEIDGSTTVVEPLSLNCIKHDFLVEFSSSICSSFNKLYYNFTNYFTQGSIFIWRDKMT